MNVQEAIESFLRHGENVKNLSTRTLRAYESDLVQFRTHLTDPNAEAVTAVDLENYVELLGAGPYRETSIRRKVAALKVFFRYLEDHGIVPNSPARLLKIRQPMEVRVPNILSMKEVRSLLLAPKRHIEESKRERERSPGARNRYFCAVRDNLIIEVLFSTGIRIGELVALDLGDVDPDHRHIRIIGRGTRPRSVEIRAQVVVDALIDYQALRAHRDLQGEALFVGRSGTRLTIYSIENIFKKYARSAEIKRHITPHALRHTMAAMLINSGTDLRSVQEILGHASILSTQVYTRLVPTRIRRQATTITADGVRLEPPSARLPIRKKTPGK